MMLIDVDDAIEKINGLCVDGNENWIGTENQSFVDHADVIDILCDAPTVDAVPVVHGRWEDVKETSLYVPDMKYTVTHTAETCSACKVRIGFIGSKPYLYDNICPHCGAKMDGGNENE